MPESAQTKTGWGLIAGNGKFPFLVLEGARSQGIEMAVIATLFPLPTFLSVNAEL